MLVLILMICKKIYLTDGENYMMNMIIKAALVLLLIVIFGSNLDLVADVINSVMR